MLKLTTAPRDLEWLDLGQGVEIQVRPITMTAILIGRAAAGDAMRGDEADKEVHAGFAFTRAVARWGIAAWRGVGDDSGAEVEPTPDLIDAFLDIWTMFDAVDRLYVSPRLAQDAEKNASAPSPNGTSAGAKDTAPPAA